MESSEKILELLEQKLALYIARRSQALNNHQDYIYDYYDLQVGIIQGKIRELKYQR